MRESAFWIRVFIGLIIVALVSWLAWNLGAYVAWEFGMKSRVQDTISEMVKNECLKDEL